MAVVSHYVREINSCESQRLTSDGRTQGSFRSKLMEFRRITAKNQHSPQVALTVVTSLLIFKTERLFIRFHVTSEKPKKKEIRYISVFF